jgi:crotonobetainyl-CoA:carnitine CoA-transferase CaiB-like acyl-CoA transferase
VKLQGLKVVDLSVFLPGPYLTLALADHGADVIKVEPPGEGDPARAIGPADGDTSAFFKNVNRGKRSVVIDLKSEAGRNALLGLCDTADVFVESFRPGVMQRLGVDYDTMRARNPGIVYCSISAFGQDGPYRDRPAHDLAVMALSGALSITLGHDGGPAMPGVATADIIASLHGLSAVLMALLRRKDTGVGDHIDIGMHHAALAALPNVMGPAMARLPLPDPKHGRSTGGSAFYQIYATRDGRHLVLGAQEMKFVRNLLGKLGRPELTELCERGPGPHQRPVIDYLSSVFAGEPLAHWQAFFADLDVSFAPVNTLREALDDEHARASGMIRLDEAGREHVMPVARFHGEPATPSLKVPAKGEDNNLLGSTELWPARPSDGTTK